MPGSLFVVATPIGNLEDLTFRALRTLREVDLIAAEDTRRTVKLLSHYQIRKPMMSLHAHNEHREAPRLVDRMRQGESVALVSDAGTPGIADPGARVVASAHAGGIRVVPVPGPSAVTAALSASGFAADQFVFLGFPPRAGQARQHWLTRLAEERWTVVFYEAPHRFKRTMNDVRTQLVDRQIIVLRELTKIHEQLVVLPIAEVPDATAAVGEFVVVVGPRDERAIEVPQSSAVVDLFWRMTERASMSDVVALDLLAAYFKLPATAVRKIIKQHLISVKQHTGGPLS
jgi:16S rRNA (cytidine1402-2'-O)-methyltransferase